MTEYTEIPFSQLTFLGEMDCIHRQAEFSIDIIWRFIWQGHNHTSV